MKHIFMMHDTKRHHDLESMIQTVMQDIPYEIVYTTSMQDSQKYIKACLQPSRFYAVGGDGTINGLLQALVHTAHELVVLPFGTGNDFCRTLTKEKNIQKILIQSLQQSSQKVDTVKINNRYYLNSACFGLDSIIANKVKDIPNIPLISESQSYIVSIFKQVFQYEKQNVKIVSNGTCLFDGPVILCTLNNGQYYGGGFQITPQAQIQDGYMDICVVDYVPKIKIPYLVTYLLTHQLHKRHEVHYYKVKEATVYCQQSGNLDGEEYKEGVYHFHVCPQSLNLVMF